MSEATIAHWEVTRAKNAGTKPNPHGGVFDKWYLSLKNLDGGEDCADAYWQRKSPSEVTVGDQVYGKVEGGDYGDRFFLEKDEDGQRPRSSEASTSNNSKGLPSGGETNWTERNAEIRRQHSQDMSLRWLAMLGPDVGPRSISDVWDVADAFDADAIAAGQRASQGQLPSPSAGESQAAAPEQSSAIDFSGARKEEPSPSEPVDDHQWLENLLVLGGASNWAAGKLATYALDKLRPDDLKKCQALLSDLDTASEGRKRLEASYEQAEGEPVPQADPLDNGDSIPF